MQAVVCGGAFSLISDIKKCPPDAVKISVNHHATYMLDCDYIVTIENKAWLKKNYLKFIDIPMVDTKGLKVIGYGGTAGISFALHRLQADQVFVAGMDLYKTDYYYTETAPKGVKRPLNDRIAFWEHYRDSLKQDAKRVIPLSGPLVEIWQQS